MPRGFAVALVLSLAAAGAGATPFGSAGQARAARPESRSWLGAGHLSHAARAHLKAKLATAEQRLSKPLSILVVDRLHHQNVAALARQTFDERGLGAGGADAVLLVLATHDGRAAIETGKGNAGIVPEIDARKIVGDLTASGLDARSAPARLSRAIDAIVASAEATVQRRRPIPAGEDLPAVPGAAGDSRERPDGDGPDAAPAVAEATTADAATASADAADAGARPGSTPRTTAPPGRSNTPVVGAILALVLVGLALGKRRQLAAERNAKLAAERAAKTTAERKTRR